MSLRKLPKPMCSLGPICALLIATGVTPLSATQVSAQKRETETGSHIAQPAAARIPDNSSMSASDKARWTAVAFGECTVRRYRKAVDRALGMPAGKPAAVTAFRNLARPECLDSGQLSMPYSLMRGAIYQALYRVDYALAQPPLLKDTIDYSKDAGANDGEGAALYASLHRFGDCVIRLDTPNSRALMLTPVAGAGEAAAFTALAPSFGDCMSSGQTISFSKAVIGGIIAETLYRESFAAAPPVRN